MTRMASRILGSAVIFLSALDDANCAAVLALLRAQAEASGATLLIATHDARLKPSFQHRLELPARS